MSLTVPHAAYVFHTTKGASRLVYGNTVALGTGEHKVTAFVAKGKRFVNGGTAMFVVPGKADHAVFRWVRSPASSKQTEVRAPTTVPIDDIEPGRRDEMRALMTGRGEVAGVNRFWTIDWEQPFRMPGWAGIRELGVAVPGWKAALPWLEWHAVGSFGLPSFEAASAEDQKSLFGVAIGAVGYLTGYEHEDVDDTSSQFCSMGTNNDCDDFSVAAASVITSILKERRASCALEAWVIQHVREACVVSGMAWPRMARDLLGRKITCGHMWVEATLTTGETIVVECTAGVAYYGSRVPTSATVRRGDAAQEYTKEYAFYVDRAVHKGEALARDLRLPAWVEALSHRPPPPSADKTYTVSTPPAQATLYGSYAARLRPCPGDHIAVKFLPFTTGTAAFVLKPTAVSFAHKAGSFAAKPAICTFRRLGASNP